MKPLIGRLPALCALLLCLLSLCGCMQTVRLKDRAIVQAVGVDYEEQSQSFLLTFQYFVPEGGGGTTTYDASKLNNDIIESRGATMTEAVDNATLAEGKQIFFGSNKILIFGRSLVEHGIHEAVNFFGSNHQLHPSVYLLVSEGDAAEVVSAQISRGIVPASAIEQIAQTGRLRHHIESGRLVDVISRLQNGRSAVTLPVVRLEQKEEDQQEVQLGGEAILKEGRLADWMDENEVEGALWLEGKTRNSLTTLDVPGLGVCSLEILESSSAKKPRLENGTVVFDITIRADSLLRETAAPVGAPGSQEHLDSIEAAQAGEILRLVQSSIEKTVSKNGADIFRLNAYVRKYLPGYWKQYRDNPGDLLENMRFNLKISCNISRMGLEAMDQKG